MQALYLLALEPIAETTADLNSYGFRPKRSTADAGEHCSMALGRKTSAPWVLEADIKIRYANCAAIKIKAAANPHDPRWEPYFEARWVKKMLNSGRGRSKLYRVWLGQDRNCHDCHQPITKSTPWAFHLVSKGAIERLEPCAGKLARTVLRGLGAGNCVWLPSKGPRYLEISVSCCRKRRKNTRFLLTAKRDKAAAMRFFEKAIQDNGTPEKVSMDRSGANKSAIDQIIEDKDISVIVRQLKYLKNIVEQGHRAVKTITKPMLGFKSFHALKKS